MGHHSMDQYSLLDDFDSEAADATFRAGASGLADVVSPRSEANAQPICAPVAMPSEVLLAASDEVRGKCQLFCDVCTALEPSEDPAAHDLLQELRRDLERTTADLRTRASLATAEKELMDSLEQLELISDVLEMYTSKAESYQPQLYQPPAVVMSPTATHVPSFESDLIDLLGPAAATVTTQPALLALTKTKSEQDFDDFFSQQAAGPVFTHIGTVGYP